MKRILFLLILCSLPPSAFAQEDPWQPPKPSSNDWDWIRLGSGEWLGGELKGLREEKVEFDSDELNLLTLDWSDVAAIYSPRLHTYGFEHLEEVTGTATLEGDTLRVRVGNDVKTYPRYEMLSIIEGEMKEISFWSLKISGNSTIRAGNVDQKDYQAMVILKRAHPKSLLSFNYTGNLGEVSGEENVNNHRVALAFDYLITRNFFVTPFQGDLYSDRFQNIDTRGSAGAGLGYFVKRGSPFEWSINLAGGYQSTTFESVEPGQDLEESSGSIITGTAFEWDITGDIDFDFLWQGNFATSGSVSNFYHTQALFSLELTDVLDFDVSFTWDRVEDPTPREDGTVPEKDDFRTGVGLGLDF
jgi:hypothetical protein